MGPHLRNALVAALALATAAPAAAGDSCSLPGGASWREYRSRHFVIDAADWDRDPARVVAEFEDVHAALLATLIAEPVEIPGHVRVIVVPSASDLADYAGSRNILGLFWISPLAEPIILIRSHDAEEVPQIVAHELAHYLSSYVFPRQPFWFSEGLAQFLESVGKADDKGHRWAGDDPAEGWAAGSIKLQRMAALLAGEGGWYDVDPVRTAWILYRFLWNERSKQFGEYQRLLMDGEAPDEAWGRAFPEWEIKSGKVNLLDYYVYHHQLNGRGVRWPVKLGEVDHKFTSGAAPLGDVHLALLGLRLLHTNSLIQNRTRRLAMEEAAREDPGHPVANAELARLGKGPLVPALRMVAEARPKDGRGWYLLGLESADPAEREKALRRAVDNWPDGALAHAALARQLATTGRAREALPLANRAVDLAPWHPTTVSSLATVAVELGQCKQALVLQTRAVEVVQSKRVGSEGADATEVKNRLGEIRKRCSAQ